jgi:hypothetical protein
MSISLTVKLADGRFTVFESSGYSLETLIEIVTSENPGCVVVFAEFLSVRVIER